MPGVLPNRKIKAIDLMENLTRLPDELLRYGHRLTLAPAQTLN